ncbi:MAG: DUF2325 domain-containing protein [Deltaproteobacteria bacterium]|nr:DUF2325 domain-containing protein [Deltaproteobacteria bacterium]MBW2069445.1 DUF2325 domain-containing protein [Deltaproteobacteria bacterium]
MVKKNQPISENAKSVEKQSNNSISEKVRLKLWEVELFFRCPLIGMCLTLSEQKRLLSKAGISFKQKTPFEIHEMLVSSLDSENRLSIKVDNTLERKFGKKTAFLFELEEEEFVRECRKFLQNWEIGSALWAIATKAKLSPKYRYEFFGTVHMIMHYSVEENLKLKSKVIDQEKKLGTIQANLKENIRQKRILRKESESLKQELAKLQSLATAAKKEKIESELENRLKSLEADNKKLKLENDVLYKELKTLRRQIGSFKKENMHLVSELEQQRRLNESFRNEAHEIINAIMNMSQCDANCPSFSLCKKRILIVGGLERMESLYRDLIEKSGGHFEYHNGHIKRGIKDLESRVRRADRKRSQGVICCQFRLTIQDQVFVL